VQHVQDERSRFNGLLLRAPNKAVETALTLPWLRTGLKAGVSDTSDHAELHSAGFADHVLVPRRIPNKLHIGFIDSVYT
jgi:hypothetical protein